MKRLRTAWRWLRDYRWLVITSGPLTTDQTERVRLDTDGMTPEHAAFLRALLRPTTDNEGGRDE